MIVDTHCHAADRWYEPIDVLLFQMDRCDVSVAILVQLLGSTDDGYMQAACGAHPDRLRYVTALDPAAPDAAAQVARVAAQGAAGLRLNLRSASHEDLLAICRTAQSCGLAISVAGPAASFVDGNLARIAAACPNLPLVLEHLGGLARPDCDDRPAAMVALAALAQFANIRLKVSGLGQLAPRPAMIDGPGLPLDLSQARPILNAALEAFGPQRLLWGSDFPPVAAREGYANALGWTRDLIAELCPSGGAAIFGRTAAALFDL